jgi:hypothetical protein
VCPINEKAFSKIIEGTKALIESIVRGGVLLRDVIGSTISHLDEMELKLNQYQAIHGVGRGVTTPEKWLGGAWGADWEMEWVHWFQNIAILIHLKVIKNDEMNGWNIMTCAF